MSNLSVFSGRRDEMVYDASNGSKVHSSRIIRRSQQVDLFFFPIRYYLSFSIPRLALSFYIRYTRCRLWLQPGRQILYKDVSLCQFRFPPLCDILLSDLTHFSTLAFYYLLYVQFFGYFVLHDTPVFGRLLFFSPLYVWYFWPMN